MVWVVVEFTDDTIATVSEQWISMRNGKVYCYWPFKDVEKKNKANAKPGNLMEGRSHECRLLMNKDKFDTYESARAAEKIAQNHSTMSSFVKSKSLRRPRKRPAKFSTSDSSEDNETEKKIFKKMEKADFRRLADAKKKYNYMLKTSTPLQNTLNNINVVSPDNTSRKTEKQKSDNQTCTNNDSNQPSSSSIAAILTENGKNPFGSCSSIRSGSSDSSGNRSCSSNDSDSSISITETEPVHSIYGQTHSPRPSLSPKNNQERSDDENILNELNYNQTHSPQPSLSPNHNQERSDHENILKEVKELKKEIHQMALIASNNTVVLEEMKECVFSSIVVLKDLSAEVFKCREEIKKRNGLFTDLLHPHIELPVVDVDHYNDVTEKLKERPVIDNLIKYIATVNNAIDEEDFVKYSLKTLFKFHFFMKDVTWKPERDRVLVKKSLIMHCWRESFKLKFGLKEPKKSDKQVNKFIHDVCRRVKDSSRKAKRTDYDF